MKILSIDIGMVSLGYCMWDSENDSMKFGICNVREMVPKKSAKDYCLIAHTFIEKRRDIFKGVNVMLLERQIKAGMKQLATALRAFLWSTANVYLVAPITVKRFFNISTGSYNTNKNAAIERFEELADRNTMLRFRLLNKKQKTDIADAFLQLHWYLFRKKIRQNPLSN